MNRETTDKIIVYARNGKWIKTRKDTQGAYRIVSLRQLYVTHVLYLEKYSVPEVQVCGRVVNIK